MKNILKQTNKELKPLFDIISRLHFFNICIVRKDENKNKFVNAVKKFKKIKKKHEESSKKVSHPHLLFPTEDKITKIKEAIFHEKAEMKQTKYNVINSINKFIKEYEEERDQ